MESLFFNLVEILKLQYKTVTELLTAAQEHNQALVNHDVSALMTVVKKQEGLLNLLAQQDRKREEIQGKIALELNIDPGVKLGQLLAKVPEGPDKEELSLLHDELKKMFMKLDEINSLNKVLAKRGLIFAQQLKNLVQPPEGSTYQGTGEMKTSEKNISVIDKTI